MDFYDALLAKQLGGNGGGGGGGGGSSVPEKDVNFYDYDGTLLHSYTAQEFAQLSDLPENPSHDGLTAQGWNWTKEQINTQLSQVGGMVDVGQSYITSDGKTRIYCYFIDGALSPYLDVLLNGTIEVDWGDNTTPDTITKSSYASTNTQHVYSSAGYYVISINVISGNFIIKGMKTSDLLTFGTANDYTNNRYSSAIRKVELGSNVLLDNNAFTYCRSLETITLPAPLSLYNNSISSVFTGCCRLNYVVLPSGMTTVFGYIFKECHSLFSVSIPPTVTSIYDYAFEYCRSLAKIIVPYSVTYLASYVFDQCYSLENITMPSSFKKVYPHVFDNCGSLRTVNLPQGATELKTYCFNYARSITKLVIPSTVTNIEAYALYCLSGIKEFHFLSSTPPTLGSNNISGCAVDTVIYVPQASLQTYKTASNWSSFASQMVGE